MPKITSAPADIPQLVNNCQQEMETGHQTQDLLPEGHYSQWRAIRSGEHTTHMDTGLHMGTYGTS